MKIKIAKAKYMTLFSQLAIKIIKGQEQIIGPIAWEEARKVKGLHVADSVSGEVTLEKDEKEVVNRLVSQYERLFGRASREVCKEAAKDLLADVSSSQLPDSLR